MRWRRALAQANLDWAHVMHIFAMNIFGKRVLLAQSAAGCGFS
jgi:hypothetical protein